MGHELTLLDAFKAFASLLFVISLIFGGLYILRRYGGKLGWIFSGPSPKSSRLQILESLAIGPKQRLIIVGRDETQHLLLVSQDAASIIEKNIQTSSTITENKISENKTEAIVK